jgi:aminoglycoside phosphotransferase family enzyme
MISPEIVRFTEDSKGEELKITEASFPTFHQIEEINLITTAISHVVLIKAEEGGFVYKLRRRVKIGDLCDFSTLRKRDVDCRREIEKNRLLAPDIYLRVVPVFLDKEDFLVFETGRGRQIDSAVKMRRFCEEDRMNNLLKQGRVSIEDIQRLAERIARYHQRLKVPTEASKYGSLKNVERIWDENFSQAREIAATSSISESLIRTTEGGIRGFLRSNRALFAKRFNQGKILDCHGDLHTGNVLIEQGEIKPFDALEFNKAYSVHDVASEVAFMAIDLEFLGFPQYAQMFVDRYVQLTGDEEMLETGLLNFYKAHRAWVRGKIEAWQGNHKKARRYFSLAESYSQLL